MINTKEIVAAVISIAIAVSFCIAIFVDKSALEIITPLLTGVVGFYLRPAGTLAMGAIKKFKK